MSQVWRKCSSCKKDILLNSKYYECSVSTCTGQRTGYVFCSVPCFEIHIPGARHRDAAAIECHSPKSLESSPAERIFAVPKAAASSGNTLSPSGGVSASQSEILIVQSKLKDYIRDKSEMNTSADVMQILSEQVRRLCDGAIQNARADGRKTVMARDFKK